MRKVLCAFAVITGMTVAGAMPAVATSISAKLKSAGVGL